MRRQTASRQLLLLLLFSFFPSFGVSATVPASVQCTEPASPLPSEQGAAISPPPPPAPVGGKVAAAEAPLNPDKLPPVVARVNGQEITRDDLVRVSRWMAQVPSEQQSAPEKTRPNGLYHQALESLIASTLLEADAKAHGITVTDAEVKELIDEERSKFHDDSEFKKSLARDGMTEQQFADVVRHYMPGLRYMEASGKVTNEMTKTFYEQNKETLKEPEQLHVRHILVKVDKDAPPADKQRAAAKINELRARLRKGEDFAKLARENSDDPGTQAEGGDLSWISRGDTIEPFEKAAFALETKGELSPIVESPFGYHIIQLLDRQAAGIPPYDQVKDKIAEMLKQRQVKAFQDRIRDLFAKADIKIFI